MNEKPKPDGSEEFPDAWERFEKGVRHRDEGKAKAATGGANT